MDLTDILMPGDVAYDIIREKVVKITSINKGDQLPIKAKSLNGKGVFYYNRCGSILPDGQDCFLYPSKENRDWDNWVRPVYFKQGDVVIADVGGVSRIAIFHHANDTGELYVYRYVGGEVTVSRADNVHEIPVECEGLYWKRISNRATKRRKN